MRPATRRHATPLLARLVLLGPATLAPGCVTNSGVDTTPTFSQARYVPPGPSAVTDPRTATAGSRAPTVRGAEAIARANSAATVDPDNITLRGATWFIEDVDPTRIYRVRTAVGRVTTILLPPGERFNGAVGGDVEGFLVNVAYAGPRPAVSVLPRSREAKGNLQLVTTGGFYSFDLLVNAHVAINLIDVGREQGAVADAGAATPQPEGDFTRLAVRPAGSGPLSAWAPAEAWADSYKMVVRFDGPLPVLPTLFAGGAGEQVVSYRSHADGRQVYLVTSRRVTEAELRLGDERARITVDPDAIRAGTAADPALGAGGWRQAAPVPPREPVPLVPREQEQQLDGGVGAGSSPSPSGLPAAPAQPRAPSPAGTAAVPPPPALPRPARTVVGA